MKYYFDLIDKYKNLGTHTIDCSMNRQYIELVVTDVKSKKRLLRQFALHDLLNSKCNNDLFEKTLMGI